MSNTEEKRHVLLCVSGGIAVYKAVEALRGLQKAGCEVRVACTRDSLEFVGAATWEGLTHERIATSLYDWPQSCIPHIELSSWAHCVLVMPATANIMAKMACGLADDLVSATLLAVPEGTPVVVAPAMNVHMWRSPATQQNVQTLVGRGVRMVMPVEGHLACDAIGEGKLAPVDAIVAQVQQALRCSDGDEGPLAGKTVVVTAGPTHEAIDPVRYIANSSSGKMGYAIAGEAARRGANVVLVSGPTSLPVPAGVRRVDVISARQMYDAATDAFRGADVAICAAAVADYTPAYPADHKLKKAKERIDVIEMVETADILAELGRSKNADGKRRVVVGFAAETNDLEHNAAAKLASKGCDMIVANDVSRSDSGFGSDTNHVVFVRPQGNTELPTLTKARVAEEILNAVQDMLA